MAVSVPNKEELDRHFESAGDKLIVIDFYATWCGPCKVIAPFFLELAEKHSDVVFLKVDVDEAEDIAQEYDIQSIPKFLFFKNKSKVDFMMGANTDQLAGLVAKHK